MLNAFITATEAKCAVLQSRNIRTPDDDPATGTSTDTITIAATGKGLEFIRGASHTHWLVDCPRRTAGIGKFLSAINLAYSACHSA